MQRLYRMRYQVVPIADFGPVEKLIGHRRAFRCWFHDCSRRNGALADV
jgi:hypothetical protein